MFFGMMARRFAADKPNLFSLLSLIGAGVGVVSATIFTGGQVGLTLSCLGSFNSCKSLLRHSRSMAWAGIARVMHVFCSASCAALETAGRVYSTQACRRSLSFFMPDSRSACIKDQCQDWSRYTDIIYNSNAVAVCKCMSLTSSSLVIFRLAEFA